MIRKLRKKAQTTAEYAILIGLVVAAVLAMQVYVKRGINAKVRDAVDIFTNLNGTANVGLGTTRQYEPYYENSNTNQVANQVSSEGFQLGGAVNRSDNTTATINKRATQGW